MLEKAQELFLPETLDPIQHVKGTAVSIGESVSQSVTKTTEAQVEMPMEDSLKESQKISNARYEEVIALYQAVDQPKERSERTSVFA